MKAKDGAKVIVFGPDKLLLFHRDDIPSIPFPDCWQLVGGGIEEGESPEEALVREVKEEVSYELKDFKLVGEIKGRQGEKVWVYVAFVGKEEMGKFGIGESEGQEIGWFSIDEALKLKLTPGTRIWLTKYRGQVEETMKTRTVSKISW